MKDRLLAMRFVGHKTLKVIALVLRFKKKSPKEIVKIVKKKYPQYPIYEDKVKKIIEKYE